MIYRNDSHDPTSGGASLCDELRAVLPAYCTGIADADERAFVEANLAACPELAPEIESYRDLAGALYYSAPPAQPPAALRARLIDAISASEQPSQTSPAPLAAPENPSQTAAYPVPQIVPLPPKRPSASARRLRQAYSLAAALVIALIGSNIYLFSRLAALNAEQEQLQQQLDVRENALELLWTDDTELVAMESTALSDTGKQPYASVVWSPQRDSVVLYVRDFPKQNPGEAYQLWLTFYGERSSPGVFEVDDEGNGLLVFKPPHSMSSCERMGITREPATGSTEPTSPPLVAFGWSFNPP